MEIYVFPPSAEGIKKLLPKTKRERKKGKRVPELGQRLLHPHWAVGQIWRGKCNLIKFQNTFAHRP